MESPMSLHLFKCIPRYVTDTDRRVSYFITVLLIFGTHCIIFTCLWFQIQTAYGILRIIRILLLTCVTRGRPARRSATV